jgi:micrococcal nuclease
MIFHMGHYSADALCSAFLFAGAACLPVGQASATAEERIGGPVAAALLRVIDGDTISLKARIWLGMELTVDARIRGIDAPEMRGKCPQEVMMAAAAKDRLAEAAGDGVLLLTAISEDKYSGRVIADITSGDGRDLGAVMLASGLARAYDGGGRGGWCDVARLGG